jgi:hypothetical protein
MSGPGFGGIMGLSEPGFGGLEDYGGRIRRVLTMEHSSYSVFFLLNPYIPSNQGSDIQVQTLSFTA